MDKTGWGRYQKRSLLIPGQPHCPLEGDKTGEPLSGPPTQEASLSPLPLRPQFNGRELEAPGCGWCVLPSVIPRGILPCPPSHPPPSAGYCRDGPSGRRRAPSVYWIPTEKCRSNMGRLAISRFTDCRLQTFAVAVNQVGCCCNPFPRFLQSVHCTV